MQHAMRDKVDVLVETLINAVTGTSTTHARQPAPLLWWEIQPHSIVVSR